LTAKKKNAKERDVDLYKRYGREDFIAEREKLNISFHNNTEIEKL
jgi:hypothetical protein